VILVDANLLVYACVSGTVHHEPSRRWFDEVLNAPERVGLPWPSLLAFVRLVVNPRVFERPMTVKRAWAQVEEWLSLDRVWIPQPTERHAEFLGKLLGNIGSRANLVPDAHLAALALEHGLTLCSVDADFARFAGLRWKNPLAPP
jgi:toxin-antitoxin system PIN domain toxin